MGTGVLHCLSYRGLRSLEEIRDLPWRDVLVNAGRKEEDELAGLRGRMEGMAAPAVVDPGAGGKAGGEAQEVEVKEKEKKKKVKKKKKRARSPSSSSQSSSTSSEVKYKAVEQKVMFGGSGLDPLRKARNRKRRRAQKYAQRSHGRRGDSKNVLEGSSHFWRASASSCSSYEFSWSFYRPRPSRTCMMLAEAGQDPEDPILKKINLTIDPKNFSILLKMVKLEASEINIMFNIILIMILINIDQY